MIDRSYAVMKESLKSVDINSLTAGSPWVKQVREKVGVVFGRQVRPCLWQVKTALATVKGDKHVLSISSTGSGKTLTFWIPVLICKDGILIVVVPLNILAKQHADQLNRVGINAIVITGDTDTASNYEVSVIYLIHNNLLTRHIGNSQRTSTGCRNQPRALNEDRIRRLRQSVQGSYLFL